MTAINRPIKNKQKQNKKTRNKCNNCIITLNPAVLPLLLFLISLIFADQQKNK